MKASEQPTLGVRLLNDNAKKPGWSKTVLGAAWCDLYSAEKLTDEPGTQATLTPGLCLVIPDGF